MAQSTDFVDREWQRQLVRINRDYALLKVLYLLRRMNGISAVPAPTSKKINVQVLAYDDAAPSGPDFSTLADTDTIYVAGHGSPEGLYALGTTTEDCVERFVKLFTMSGTLQAKRKNKTINILLLSCRAGLGLHQAIARELYNKTAIVTNVGGAIGFTFGSWETGMVGLNEVLIEGIPWWMEYGIPPKKDAERLTSEYEGSPITIASKQAQIDTFKYKANDDQHGLTAKMKAIVNLLQSTEVNALLDELEAKHNEPWRQLIEAQFLLYAKAKTDSDLGFSMWHPHVSDGYVWVNSDDVTDSQLQTLLAGQLHPINGELTSTR